MSIRKGGYRGKNEEIHVVICEHDTYDPLLSHGAIIAEQYTMDSPEEVAERAKSLANGSKYGRVWVAKLTDITEIPRIARVTITEADRPD